MSLVQVISFIGFYDMFPVSSSICCQEIMEMGLKEAIIVDPRREN